MFSILFSWGETLTLFCTDLKSLSSPVNRSTLSFASRNWRLNRASIDLRPTFAVMTCPHETRIYLINNQPIKTEYHLLTYTLTLNIKVLQYSRENDIEDLTPQTISTFILFSFSLGMVHLLHHWHQFHLICPWPISGPLEGHLKTKLWQPSRIFSLLQKIIISILLDWRSTLVLLGLKVQSNICIKRKMIQVFLTHTNIFFYILILHLSDCIEYTILTCMPNMSLYLIIYC